MKNGRKSGDRKGHMVRSRGLAQMRQINSLYRRLGFQVSLMAKGYFERVPTPSIPEEFKPWLR